MRKPTRVDSSQMGLGVVDAPNGKGAVAAQVIKICLLLKILPIKCFAFSPEAHLREGLTQWKQGVFPLAKWQV